MPHSTHSFPKGATSSPLKLAFLVPFLGMLGLAETADAEEEVPETMGYGLRLGPTIATFRELDWDTAGERLADGLPFDDKAAAVGGLQLEGELLQYFGTSGFMGASSLGVGYLAGDAKQWVMPLKAHFGFADQHGFRVSVSGNLMPTFSSVGTGFYAGLGGQMAYDFDLASEASAWQRRDAPTWGLGLYAEGNALSCLNDGDALAEKGDWIGMMSFGALARFH